jgi:hypothetical protein
VPDPVFFGSAEAWRDWLKRQETRQRRLARLVADSAEGRRLGHLSRDRRQ